MGPSSFIKKLLRRDSTASPGSSLISRKSSTSSQSSTYSLASDHSPNSSTFMEETRQFTHLPFDMEDDTLIPEFMGAPLTRCPAREPSSTAAYMAAGHSIFGGGPSAMAY